MVINKENELLIFNGKEYEIEDTGKGQFRWEVDIQELMLFNFSTKDFPKNILTFERINE